MTGGAPLPVREYTDARQMRRDAAELRARMFAPRPAPAPRHEPVKIVMMMPPRADDVASRELIEPGYAKPDPKPVEQIVAVAPTALPATRAQRDGRASLRGTDCLRIVAEVTGLKQADIKGPSRVQVIVRARQIAAWLLVNRAGKSLPESGRFLGGRDHTTILHACRRVDAVMLPAAVMKGDAVELAVALWAATKPPAYRGAR